MPTAIFTREDIAAYAAAIAHLHLDAIALPVTRTESGDLDALSLALEDDYDAIMVASARGAEAIVEALPDTTPRELWAVGPSTARVLLAAGLAVRTPDDGTDAVALARAILARRPPPRRVLAPRAEDGRDEGIALLRSGGAIVDELVAYRTLARDRADPLLAPGLAALGSAAVICVFAPSQVTALVTLLGELANVRAKFVAIGATTGAALLAAGVPAAVAASPTPAGMAEAIAAVYPPQP